MRRYIETKPPVYGEHGRAGKVIAKRHRPRINSRQAGSLQLQRRSEAPISIMNAKIPEHPAQCLVRIDIHTAGKGTGHADDVTLILVDSYPGLGLSMRVVAIEPVKPGAIGMRGEIAREGIEE